MTILIHAIDDQIVTYPDSMDALRKAHPNVSFPVQPTDEDLAAFNRYRVTSTPQPAHDARTERVDEADPVLTADGWQQTWSTRPATEAEQAAWDIAHAPQPQWMQFGLAMATSPAIAALYAAVPGPVANALSIGLSDAAKGDDRLFISMWQHIATEGTISAELLAEITAAATQCHLPQSFINSLQIDVEV